jgi:hypothetical protein
MDETLISRLLEQGEGSTLDYKEEPYVITRNDPKRAANPCQLTTTFRGNRHSAGLKIAGRKVRSSSVDRKNGLRMNGRKECCPHEICVQVRGQA